MVGRERQYSLLFAKKLKTKDRKLAALSGNDKTSSQWLEDGGRRGWTHPLLFVDRFWNHKTIYNKSCFMNTELILNTGIQNIATVNGGVRGITLTSRHNMCHWQTVVDSEIRTIIELRDKDHSDRLCRMCEIYGIRYFAFPMDSHSVPNKVIASQLHEFFELIDNGDFYIACAMGLHRTDMELSIYWMFH